MKKRAVVSIILFATFLLLPVTALFIDHSNATVAYIAKGLHGHIGMIFTVAGIFHIVYNRKALKLYFRPKKRNTRR